MEVDYRERLQREVLEHDDDQLASSGVEVSQHPVLQLLVERLDPLHVGLEVGGGEWLDVGAD